MDNARRNSFWYAAAGIHRGGESVRAHDRIQAAEHDALSVRQRRTAAPACDLGLGPRLRAIPGCFRQSHAAFPNHVCADLWTDRRSADHPILDAIHPAADVLRGRVVHLSHRHAAFFPARGRLGGPPGRGFHELSFYFVRISNGQSVGAALVVVHRGAARRRDECAARNGGRSSLRVLLRHLDEILPFAVVALSSPR